MKAYGPNGLEILGTADTVPVRAEIISNSYERKADGTLDFEWLGESEVFWDGQTTETCEVNGKLMRVFLDSHGNEWTEDQLILVEDEEDAK